MASLNEYSAEGEKIAASGELAIAAFARPILKSPVEAQKRGLLRAQRPDNEKEMISYAWEMTSYAWEVASDA